MRQTQIQVTEHCLIGDQPFMTGVLGCAPSEFSQCPCTDIFGVLFKNSINRRAGSIQIAYSKGVASPFKFNFGQSVWYAI
ncbi:MAG: hypothetical protein ABJ205_01380 [Erythrobacter sp.]|uniref:hypothetical protein n=1 Tax=Erythrobacter sp. TaxID=1042 RepID=UPI0032674961